MDLMSQGRRPPLVKATIQSSDFYLDDNLFERVLGVPSKIQIPDRYIPPDPDEEERDPEEDLKRARKAEAICKLLAKAGGPSTSHGLSTPNKAQHLSPVNHPPRPKVKGTSSQSSSGIWSGTSSRLSGSITSPQSLPVSPLRRQALPSSVLRKPSDFSLNRSSFSQ